MHMPVSKQNILFIAIRNLLSHGIQNFVAIPIELEFYTSHEVALFQLDI